MVTTNMIASCMTVMAGIVSIIGTNAMKYSHTKNSKLPADEQTTYFMRCDWWIAFTGEREREGWGGTSICSDV